jgi:hypothetical protein
MPISDFDVLVHKQEYYRWRKAGKIQREILVEAGMVQIKITVPVARY